MFCKFFPCYFYSLKALFFITLQGIQYSIC